MIEVLLVSARRRHEDLYVDSVRSFHELGARVRLATFGRLESTDDHGLDEVHDLAFGAEGHPPEFWRSSVLLPRTRRVWAYVERDEWTLARAQRAHVLVAVDPQAVHTVWQLAQRNRTAIARSGLHAAVRDLGRALDQGTLPTPVVPAAPVLPGEPGPPTGRTDEPGASPRRRRFGAGAVQVLRRDRVRDGAGDVRELTDPDVPAAERVERTVARVGPLFEGREQEAAALVSAVAPTLKPGRQRADLYGAVVAHQIAAGVAPVLLHEAVVSELGYADALLARGRVRAAVASFLQAARLAFHPAIHFDSLESPLSADPEAFTAAVRHSAVLRRLTASRGRERPPEPPPGDRPPRVLVLSEGNTNFLGDLLTSLALSDGAETRVVTLADLDAPLLRGDHHRLFAALAVDEEKVRTVVEDALRPHLDWADVVLVEWCTRMAHLVTLVDPGTCRVVLRLHSFEAWTLWPHVVDHTRIDEVVLVSDHLRELVRAAVPQLRAEGGPRTSVVPNVVDLHRFVRPKDGDVRFTLAMLGYGVVAKDVRWAMEVVRGLRRHDRRYRLVLFGDDLRSSGTPAHRRYREAYLADLAELEPAGAVVRRGRATDVPGALAGAGVVLSASLRESAHLAVVEGAASGAVPVVRDWPFFAAQEFGARTFYPREWVVGSVDAAVERVLSVTGTVEAWQQESADAARTALTTWDADVTFPALRAVLLGRGGPPDETG